MDENLVKKSVQEHYARIALGGQSSCCSGTNDCCGSTTNNLLQITDLFEDAGIQSADLGLSCGLPTFSTEIRPGDVVLDLGSGAGVDVLRAARLVGDGGFVIGVDMTPEMVIRAQQNALSAGYSNVEFRLGDIESLPVHDESVDVVISNCVINLVPNKKQVFREVYRVLRPGGRISISDIVTFGEMPDDIRNDLALWAGCIAGAIDRDLYLSILQECGFINVSINQEVQYDPPELVWETSSKGRNFGIASITVGAIKPQ